MATTRFKTTMDAIKGGLKSFSVEKGVQNIEGWEDYLSKHDHEGVKAVVQDLGKLKKLLQAKEIDGEAVKKLIAKVGKDTVKVAGDGENAEAKHIRELGEALSQAAEKEEGDEDEKPKGKADEDDEEEDDDEEGEDEEDGEEDGDDEDEDDEEGDDDEDEVEEDGETKAPAKKAPAKKAAAKKAPAKKSPSKK